MFSYKTKLLSICLFYFLTLSTVSQNKKIDSLKTLLKESNSITEKIDINILLGKLNNRSNVDFAFKYFKKAIRLSEKENLASYKTQSYSSIATSYIIKGKFDSAHFYFNKSEKLLPIIKDYKIKTAFFGDKGVLHYYEGNIEKAAENFENALKISKLENDKEDIIKFSNNTALAYTQLGKNERAIEIYYETLKLAEKEDDKKQVGKLLNNIGLIYENMNQFKNALEFYEKSLVVKKDYGTQIDNINAHYNIANMQLKLSDKTNDSLLLNEAKKNFITTLNLSNTNQYGNGKLYGLEGLGQIAFNKKNYTEATQVYSKMDSISEAIKNIPMIGVSNLKLGVIAVEKNEFNIARKKLFKAKTIIEKSGVQKDKAQLYYYLNLLYAKEANFKEAYKYLALQKEINDKLSSKNLQDKISDYEVKYQTEKKEKEIVIQKEELLEQELAIKKRNIYTILLLASLIILGIIFFAIYKKNQFKRKQLQKEIDLKDALATIKTQNRLQEQRLRISRDLHDNIGSQLTFIISSIDNLKYVTKDANQKLKEKLSTISSFTSDTIYQLRDTIWAMNKSEITVEDLHARILSFVEKAKIASQNIEFEITDNIDKNESFSSLVGMNIFRVIQEAINNALKYAEATKIEIKLQKINNLFEAVVKDNGVGFNIKSVELGNGLSNMEKRMSEIEGKIKINSEVEKGTEIQITVSLKNTSNDV